MSGFLLVPVDGAVPVQLPRGETVLGRGPFLGVIDKRVSRRHGLLENLDGRLRVKPVHANPCFVQAAPGAQPRPLQKDRWYPLRHGELLSLLPGQLVFRVEAVGGAPSRRPGDGEEGLPAAGRLGDGEDVWTPGRGSAQDVTAAPPLRRRVLPAWMMAVTAPKTPPPAVRGQSSVKTSNRAARATPTAGSSHEEAGRQRKRRMEMSDEEEKPATDAPSRPAPVRLQRDTGRAGLPDPLDRRSPEEEAGGGGGASEEETKASVPPEPVRTPCPYGKDCYRRNPLHFQECSHPGDHDYREDEERPECPHGTDCYRRNPLHRKEFKHTRRPARSTRPAADDDEDDHGFINDDSEDSGGDSDYVPRASDDSEKEERLQREARSFLKRRK